MTPNLWRDPSPSEALAEIREALDTRSSLEGQKWARGVGMIGRVEDVANALIEWLESLGSPVLGESLLNGIEMVQGITCSFVDMLLAMVMMSELLSCVASAGEPQCIHLSHEVFAGVAQVFAVESARC